LSSNKSDGASKREENVPRVTQKISESKNHLISSGPNKNVVIKTNNKVKLVKILLLIVSVREILIIS